MTEADAHEIEQGSEGGEDVVPPRCPLLGEALREGTLICLADVEPVLINKRYGDSYCLTDQHVYCSLYIAAASGRRSESPQIVAALDLARRRSQVEQNPPPGNVQSEDHTVVETRPTGPADPDAAAALSRELDALVQSLTQRIKSTKGGNAVMERRLRMLEELAGNPDFLRRALVAMPGIPMSSEDLLSVQLTLRSLLQNPQDLRGLAQLAGHSDRLLKIFNAYSQISSMLDETA